MFYPPCMKGRLPLPALLSHLLVAFTIEFDNEAEHRTAARLVSLAMWSNCMQFVDEKGVTVRELERAARTKTNLNGMVRWGYVSVEPGDTKAPRSKWSIRPTPAGRSAQEIWRPLFAIIEGRWRQRFGEAEMAHLRKSLEALIDQVDIDLPDCLPILGYGLYSQLENPSFGSPVTRPPCGYRRCSPKCCWRLPSTSKANPRSLSRSVPTCCASLARKESRSATCLISRVCRKRGSRRR
jgi:hypothetical protein